MQCGWVYVRVLVVTISGIFQTLGQIALSSPAHTMQIDFCFRDVARKLEELSIVALVDDFACKRFDLFRCAWLRTYWQTEVVLHSIAGRAGAAPRSSWACAASRI